MAELAGVKAPYVLPTPSFNIINGGSHAGNGLAFQEFMILPTGASNFTEAMKMGTECYHALKSIIKKKYGLDNTAIGDEGGFAPSVKGAEDSLELLVEAIKAAGHEGKITISLDAATTEIYTEGKYDLDFKVSRETPDTCQCTERPLNALVEPQLGPFHVVDW